MEARLELVTAQNGCLPPPKARDVYFSASGSSLLQPLRVLRQCENGGKARRAEKCKRLRIFIDSTPSGEGQVPDLDDAAPRK